MIDSSLLLQWVLLLAALLLAWSALMGAWGKPHRLDGLCLATLLPFAALAALELFKAQGLLKGDVLVPVTRVTYQLMILGVTGLLMAMLKGVALRYRLLLGVQTVLGLGLALWPASAWPYDVGAAWGWLNIACTTALVLVLVRSLWRLGATRAWMVLLVAMTALGVMYTDLDASTGNFIDVSWPQVLLTAALIVLWLVVTRRIGASADAAPPTASVQAFRRQLAQDLHDGVGSHLSTLISALDAGPDEQRATAAQLRECLVELKLMVDGVDEDASLLSLLANLRYRMQPLMQAAHIDVHWAIADEQWLDAIRGGPARQVLRIAQEALANAVRHSGASRVSLTCCYARSNAALLLEIADDGVGMRPPGNGVGATVLMLGKGLSGMHARARQLGGRLSIQGQRGAGVHLVLKVPMRKLRPDEAQPLAS